MWRQRKNIWYIVTISIGTVALILTFSRSAWVVAAFGMLVIWFWKQKLSIVQTIISVAVGFALLVGFATAPIQEESVVVRHQLNIAAIELWKHAPWVGIGAGNFLVALPASLISRQIYILQPVHNIYLLLLSEFGLIGIVLVCGIAAQSLSTHFSLSRFISPFGFSIVSLCALGFVDHYMFTLQQGQLLFVIMFSLLVVP
jgi:O-antigen ligase